MMRAIRKDRIKRGIERASGLRLEDFGLVKAKVRTKGIITSIYIIKF